MQGNSNLLWDLLTRLLPPIIVYLWSKYDGKKKLKQLTISNSQYQAKASFYPRIMQLKEDEKIKECVNRIFEQTRATRFLILLGVNKKDPTQHVSVFFSRKKEDDGLDPKKLYQNLPTDNQYKEMLKRLKAEKEIVYDVFEMPRGMLKSIYYKEQISHSIIKEIAVTPIDEDNNAYAFSSIATDTEEPFTEFDRLFINKEFNLIKKYLKE